MMPSSASRHRVVPEVALIVSTFQRPGHLRRTLASIEAQTGGHAIEVVVADDGSRDETADIVRRFARGCSFPVTFVTHEHAGFQLARCRNEGVAASRANYLMFVDGDCVLPPDYVTEHLRRRRQGVALSSDVVRLPKAESDRVTLAQIAAGETQRVIPRNERRRVRLVRVKALWYQCVRHPRKPRLFGGASSLWRDDYMLVNGYDENFNGWGAEDDDMRDRLRRCGVRIRSIPVHAAPLHLWHPVDETTPTQWRQGRNVRYLLRRGKLRRCVNGIRKLERSQLLIRVLCDQLTADVLAILPAEYRYVARGYSGYADVEIGLHSGTNGFTGQADCRVLVVQNRVADVPRRLAARADYVVSPPADVGGRENDTWTPRSSLEELLDHVCGFRSGQQPVSSAAFDKHAA